MTRRNTKTFVIIMAMILIAIAGGLIWNFMDEKHDRDMIKEAQTTQINPQAYPGVTLIDAINAHYGNSGEWFVINGKVCVNVTDTRDGDNFYFMKAEFAVNEKTQQLDLLSFETESGIPSQSQLDSMLSKWCEQALVSY